VRRLGVLGVCALTLWCSAAYGQQTSTMLGQIADASTGKPIEGAVVVVKSPALQGEKAATTGADGQYSVTLLPAGVYSVRVNATGYRPFDRSDIAVPLARTIRVNVALTPVPLERELLVVPGGRRRPAAGRRHRVRAEE